MLAMWLFLFKDKTKRPPRKAALTMMRHSPTCSLVRPHSSQRKSAAESSQAALMIVPVAECWLVLQRGGWGFRGDYLGCPVA